MSNINELTVQLKAAAQKASGGNWIKESGDGWEAMCSSDGQENDGLIIAHFEGPDAAANREFAQAANPANILALIEALEAAEKRIAELSTSHTNLREAMAGIHNTITGGGAYTPLVSILNASKRAYEESAAAAGIKLQIEGE